MKTQKIILSVVLFFSFAMIIQAKEKTKYKCAYNLKILSDTLNYKYFRSETYILQINDDITKGFTYQKYYNDSLKKANKSLAEKNFRDYISQNTSKALAGDFSFLGDQNPFYVGAFASTLFKDYKENKIRVIDHISIHDFIFDDELKPQDWQIQSDTMTVLEYHSQKATCHYRGRNWIAWFTNEIPLSEGPWKFYGLPGLITKIEDDKGHYSFTLTGFQGVEEPIDTQISTKVEKTTRKKFIEMSKAGELEILDIEAVGLSTGSKKTKNNLEYDYIETDYKEWVN